MSDGLDHLTFTNQCLFKWRLILSYGDPDTRDNGPELRELLLAQFGVDREASRELFEVTADMMAGAIAEDDETRLRAYLADIEADIYAVTFLDGKVRPVPTIYGGDGPQIGYAFSTL